MGRVNKYLNMLWFSALRDHLLPFTLLQFTTTTCVEMAQHVKCKLTAANTLPGVQMPHEPCGVRISKVLWWDTKLRRLCSDIWQNVIRRVDGEEAEPERTRADRELLRCAEYVPWITGFIWAVCYYRRAFITIIRDGVQVCVFTPSLISGWMSAITPTAITAHISHHKSAILTWIFWQIWVWVILKKKLTLTSALTLTTGMLSQNYLCAFHSCKSYSCFPFASLHWLIHGS